jgi:hypothetical protein
MTPQEFAKQFNSRTIAFLPSYADDGRPVVVAIGNTAHNPAGHLLASALTNQLARAHRRLLFIGDLDRSLLCPSPFGHSTLREATVGLAREINPLIDTAELTAIPSDALISIGLSASAELEVGATGWCALFGSGASISDSHETLLGAGLASALVAATAFHRLRGIGGAPHGSYSLWKGGSAGDEQGPSFDCVDVGDVLQVGAGAVGAALDYWLASFGFGGNWLIMDGDEVDASNLNRQLLFRARDAGFPEGEPANKAEAAALRTGGGASALPYFYGDERAGDALRMFDLILPLANEGGVRASLQARPQPVLLHATTSTWWSAQLHRHVAGLDDCIVCRLPKEEDPAFTCTTGDVSSEGEKHMDASLPFLAAAAGLLLLMGLVRLQMEQLVVSKTNQLVISLEVPDPRASESEWQCREDCHVRLPAARRIARAKDTRWVHLDEGQVPAKE